MPPRPKKSKAPPKHIWVLVHAGRPQMCFDTEAEAAEQAIDSEVVYRYELWKGKKS